MSAPRPVARSLTATTARRRFRGNGPAWVARRVYRPLRAANDNDLAGDCGTDGRGSPPGHCGSGDDGADGLRGNPVNRTRCSG